MFMAIKKLVALDELDEILENMTTHLPQNSFSEKEREAIKKGMAEMLPKLSKDGSLAQQQLIALVGGLSKESIKEIFMEDELQEEVDRLQKEMADFLEDVSFELDEVALTRNNPKLVRFRSEPLPPKNSDDQEVKEHAHPKNPKSKSEKSKN